MLEELKLDNEIFYEADEPDEEDYEPDYEKDDMDFGNDEPDESDLDNEDDDDDDNDDEVSDKSDDDDSSSDDDEADDDNSRYMTYERLEQYGSDDDDDDDFGKDDSDIQNDYNTEDIDALNANIADEVKAIKQYFESAQKTENPMLSRLYGHIGAEEAMHVEELNYAKSKITGENYVPSDPEVKKDYEELLDQGMDEDDAMNTALDKYGIYKAAETELDDDDSDNTEEIEEIETMEYALEQTVMLNLTLSSMDRTEIFTEYYNIAADITIEPDSTIQEAVASMAEKAHSGEFKFHPFKFIRAAINAIGNFIRDFINKIKGFIRKKSYKSRERLKWLKKHGIKDLFKEGVWLYLWDESGSIRAIDQSFTPFMNMIIALSDSILKTIGKGKETISQEVNNLPAGLKFRNIDQGIDKLRQTVFTKSKVIVTDTNQDELANLFFGLSRGAGLYGVEKLEKTDKDDEMQRVVETKSVNIYNIFEKYANYLDISRKSLNDVADTMEKMEGKPNTLYGYDRNLYNKVIKWTQAVLKEITKFDKILSHDMNTCLNLDNGLFQLMKDYDAYRTDQGRDVQKLKWDKPKEQYAQMPAEIKDPNFDRWADNPYK